MARTLPSVITTEKNKSLNFPLEIYDVQITSTDWVHFADSVVEFEEDSFTVLSVESNLREFVLNTTRVNALLVGMRIKVTVSGTDESREIIEVRDRLIKVDSPIADLAAGQTAKTYSLVTVFGFEDDHGGDRQSYFSFPVQRSPVHYSLGGSLDSVSVGFGNADREFSAAVMGTDIRGNTLSIRRVYQNLLGTAENYIPIFKGIMDNPMISESVVTLSVRSRFDIANEVVPRRTFSPFCPWVWGGNECVYPGVLCATGSTTTIIFLQNVTEFGRTIPARDQFSVDDVILVEGTGVGATDEETTITNLFATSVQVSPALTNAPTNGKIVIHKDCDKRFATCDKRRNSTHFGGFPQVPSQTLRI